MPTSIRYLKSAHSFKITESILLPDEKVPHHLGQVVVWIKYLYLHIFYLDDDYEYDYSGSGSGDGPGGDEYEYEYDTDNRYESSSEYYDSFNDNVR